MKYEEEKLENESLSGKTFWVCGYYYRDYSDKPLRHVKPCEVVGEFKLHDEANPYRYEWWSLKFKCIGKKGRILKTTHNYLSNCRVRDTLQVFDNEEECRNHYVSLCDKHIKGFEKYIQKVELDIEEVWNNKNKFRYDVKK